MHDEDDARKLEKVKAKLLETEKYPENFTKDYVNKLLTKKKIHEKRLNLS